MKQVDLLENPGAAVSGNLLDDLDRVLNLGVYVHAGLDRGVGALSELLPSQSVQLLAKHAIVLV